MLSLTERKMFICLSGRSNKVGRRCGDNKPGNMHSMYGMHRCLSGTGPYSSAAFAGTDGTDVRGSKICT